MLFWLWYRISPWGKLLLHVRDQSVSTGIPSIMLPHTYHTILMLPSLWSERFSAGLHWGLYEVAGCNFLLVPINHVNPKIWENKFSFNSATDWLTTAYYLLSLSLSLFLGFSTRWWLELFTGNSELMSSSVSLSFNIFKLPSWKQNKMHFCDTSFVVCVNVRGVTCGVAPAAAALDLLLRMWEGSSCTA